MIMIIMILIVMIVKVTVVKVVLNVRRKNRDVLQTCSLVFEM